MKKEFKNLRRVRNDMGLSLRDVGADLDVNYSIISFWESGTRSPSRRNIIKLEKYFEKDIKYLMGVDEHANHPQQGTLLIKKKFRGVSGTW